MIDILKKKFPGRYSAKRIFLPLLVSLLLTWILHIFFDLNLFPGDIPIHSSLVIFPAILSLSLYAFAIIDFQTYKQQRILINNTFHNMLPLCITNTDFDIILANDAYWNIFGRPVDMDMALKCHDHRPGENCKGEKCPLGKIMTGSEEYHCESVKTVEGRTRHFLITARPVRDHKNRIAGIIESFQDITDRRELEIEKEKLIEELQESMKNVKVLSGLLPICASCKKVRDDNGYWEQIEIYIRNHSEADFTHGICPDCINRLYPEK